MHTTLASACAAVVASRAAIVTLATDTAFPSRTARCTPYLASCRITAVCGLRGDVFFTRWLIPATPWRLTGPGPLCGAPSSRTNRCFQADLHLCLHGRKALYSSPNLWFAFWRSHVPSDPFLSNAKCLAPVLRRVLPTSGGVGANVRFCWAGGAVHCRRHRWENETDLLNPLCQHPEGCIRRAATLREHRHRLRAVIRFPVGPASIRYC
jgi:hypothetical protein